MCSEKVRERAIMLAHTLTPDGVRQHTTHRSSGFYRIGSVYDGDFFMAYFGRSDRDLRQRLMSHARNGTYDFFQVQETETVRRAFELECREFHLTSMATDNKYHPAAPDHSNYECPYCALETKVDQLLEASV